METITSCKLYFYKGLYFITPSDENIDLSFVHFQNGEIVERNIIERDISLHRENTRKNSSTYENPYYKKRQEEKKKEKTFSEENASKNSYDNARTFKYFSNEAQNDIHILKKEYHELVKKYHPDVNDDKDSDNIIKEIFEERERIISNFCQ